MQHFNKSRVFIGRLFGKTDDHRIETGQLPS
jgi:hypothetical protein